MLPSSTITRSQPAGAHPGAVGDARSKRTSWTAATVGGTAGGGTRGAAAGPSGVSTTFMVSPTVVPLIVREGTTR